MQTHLYPKRLWLCCFCSASLNITNRITGASITDHLVRQVHIARVIKQRRGADVSYVIAADDCTITHLTASLRPANLP
jgi:hypothetical protein